MVLRGPSCGTPGLREGVAGSRRGAERRGWEQVRLVAAGLGWREEALRLLVRCVRSSAGWRPGFVSEAFV